MPRPTAASAEAPTAQAETPAAGPWHPRGVGRESEIKKTKTSSCPGELIAYLGRDSLSETKLWFMGLDPLVLCDSGATQDRRVMVDRSDRTWSTGEGNGKPLQYSCLENPTNSMKRQKDRILNDELPRSVGAHMLLEINGEITPERMKR